MFQQSQLSECQRRPNISPPGAFTWKVVLKYKVKQSKTVNLLKFQLKG